MIGLPLSVRIYLFCAPVDMRNGFDGLSSVVTRCEEDLFSGHLFVFISKRRDRIKILTWDSGGFVLWYKRLEQGHFKPSQISEEQKTLTLDSGQLSMLLDGVDYSRVRRSKKWQPGRKKASKPDPNADFVQQGIDTKKKV